MINRKSQLYRYIRVFIVLIIFLVIISGKESYGVVKKDNSLDTSKGQTYSSHYVEYPREDGSSIRYESSSLQNIYEDNVWKKKKDSKSLVNKSGFSLLFSEVDPDFSVKIIDYNYSFSKVCFSSTHLFCNIPLVAYKSVCGADFDNSTGDVSQPDIFCNDKFFPFYLDNKLKLNHSIKFLDSNEQCFMLSNPDSLFGLSFKFGYDSTGWTYWEDSNSTSCWNFWSAASPCSNTYDGKNYTEGQADIGTGAGVQFNYTIPSGALSSSKWQIIDYLSTNVINLTIPSGCWDGNLLRFSAYSNYAGTDYVNWRCWNYTSGTNAYLRNYETAAPRIYEEGMWWYILDSAPPYFTSHLNNQTAPKYNENINLSIDIKDDNDIDFVIFSTNDSGSWGNFSSQPTATTTHFNYTVLSIASIKNTLVGYAWYANDTSSNVNRTLNQSDDSYYFFRVGDAPSITNTADINPSSPYITDTLNCGANVTEADNGWAYTNFTWFFRDNDAGAWHLNATEVLINITSNAYGNTTIDINSTWLNKDDVWLCQATSYDAGGSSSLNSSSVTILELAPTIDIIYPVSSTTYTDNVTTINYVYTSSNPNKCWYSLNNSANTTVSCGTNVTGLNAIEGSNLWKIWINSTYGTLDSSSVTFEFTKWVENFQTFNNYTYETENETFIANFTLRAGADLYSAKFIYNGTSYSVPNIQTIGNDIILTKSINVHLNPTPFEINSSKEFYWSFVYTYGVSQIEQNLTEQRQNVTYINLQLCNTTFSTEALNFTFRDELDGIEINPAVNSTSIETSFKYWLGGGDIYKNYSYANITSNSSSQYQFCIYPSWETILSDMDMDYGAEGYADRTYYFRVAPLDNVTNDIDLNLISSADYTKFFFEVRKGMLPFAEATVTISKYDAGEDVWKTIGIRETDVNGKFIEYIELDKKYRFSFVKDGASYGYIDKVASCAETPCEITLQIEEAITHLWEGYYDVFATKISYTLAYNDTNKLVTYSFNDLTGLAQNFRLKVTKLAYNQSSSTICEQTIYTTTGTMTCNMTGQTGDFTAIGYVSRSPEKIVDILNFIISVIKDALGITGVLVSLFIIITIGLVGYWNPTVGVILLCFAVFMMKLLGFVAFGYTSVILVFVLGGILAYQMKR